MTADNVANEYVESQVIENSGQSYDTIEKALLLAEQLGGLAKVIRVKTGLSY